MMFLSSLILDLTSRKANWWTMLPPDLILIETTSCESADQVNRFKSDITDLSTKNDELKKQVMKVSTRDLFPANSEILDGVNNLAELGYLNEPSVLYNIYYRYQRDVIYTIMGPVLLANNPFKDVRISGSDVIMAYKEKILDSPHVYKIAEIAYNDMMRDGDKDVLLQQLLILLTLPVSCVAKGKYVGLDWFKHGDGGVLMPWGEVRVVCVMEWILHNKCYSKEVNVAVVVVVIGVGVCTVTDVKVNAKAPIQALSLLVFDPFIDYYLSGRLISDYMKTISSGVIIFILSSCSLAVFCNISRYLCIGRFSAVSFQYDFSFGNTAFHQETLGNLKMAIKSTKKLCAVMLDIVGPKLQVVNQQY
ncbi:hypothetical protein L2E82_32692 [Cichorium intybus]|uniref:Uncharacterized protein n=1 Tax=Cichorium intybus TaxID=13427 RepID=A0ACB9BJ34_CICIN|nr:hypothetical protein L2E82_32692 [Cichorium intybus]